jgi:hypothetical protein
MSTQHSIFELHLLRIAKFAFGVRQFIAAFNDGIYSVPYKCREMNFAKQGGNELPHSTERYYARKSNSKLQDSLVMLKLIAQGRKNIEEGKIRAFKESFSFIRRKTAGKESLAIK